MLTHIEVQGLISVQNLAEQLTSPLPTRSSPAGGPLLGQNKQSETYLPNPKMRPHVSEMRPQNGAALWTQNGTAFRTLV